MAKIRRWRGLHWLSFFLMTGLCAFGVMVIYSATHTSESADLRNAAIQQAAWVGLGLVCFFLLSFSDYHRWVAQGWLWFAAGLLLLGLVLVFGREVNGAKSWIRLGPVGFQPAEVMKLAFLAGACALLVSMRERIEQFRAVLALVGLALIPVFLILRQPDLGSAAVFLPMCFGLLFAGAPVCATFWFLQESDLPPSWQFIFMWARWGKSCPSSKPTKTIGFELSLIPTLIP